MLWIAAYFALLTLPVIALAGWELVQLLRCRLASAAGTTTHQAGSAGPLAYLDSPSQALECTWFALRAQFLVAPGRALEEAEDFLRTLSPDAEVRASAGRNPAWSGPRQELLRLQSEFERILAAGQRGPTPR